MGLHQIAWNSQPCLCRGNQPTGKHGASASASLSFSCKRRLQVSLRLRRAYSSGSSNINPEDDATDQLVRLSVEELLAVVELAEAEQEGRAWMAQEQDEDANLDVASVDYDFLFGVDDPDAGGGVPVRELVGWKVVLVRGESPMKRAKAAIAAGEEVTTAHRTAVITEVIEMSEAAMHLVRVSLGGDDGGEVGDGSDEAEGVLIPLVDSIFNIAAQGVLVGAPPAGLLQLGTIGKAWDLLEDELLPVARNLAGIDAKIECHDGSIKMPSASELRMANRRDLEVACRRVGGTLIVAEAFGLRASRKPSGYWDDLEKLRRGITEFCITTLGLSEEEAWMPRQAQVKTAGRWDLHHAIVKSGGYEDVAEMLGLTPLSAERYRRRLPSSVHRQNRTLFVAAKNKFEKDWRESCRKGDQFKRILASDVVASIKTAVYLEQQLSVRGKSPMTTLKIPSINELCKDGLFYEAGAVALLGSAQLIEYAESFITMRPAHRPRGHWNDIEAVAEEVREFAESLGTGKKMPTQKMIKHLGRNDLLYGINKYGAQRIAALTGLKLDTRGGHKHAVYKHLKINEGKYGPFVEESH